MCLREDRNKIQILPNWKQFYVNHLPFFHRTSYTKIYLKFSFYADNIFKINESIYTTKNETSSVDKIQHPATIKLGNWLYKQIRNKYYKTIDSKIYFHLHPTLQCSHSHPRYNLLRQRSFFWRATISVWKWLLLWVVMTLFGMSSGSRVLQRWDTVGDSSKNRIKVVKIYNLNFSFVQKLD